MPGVTADGVFLYIEAGTTTQMMPYGRLQIVQKLSDAKQHFQQRISTRRGNDNNADDALWAIVNRSEVIRC